MTLPLILYIPKPLGKNDVTGAVYTARSFKPPATPMLSPEPLLKLARKVPCQLPRRVSRRPFTFRLQEYTCLLATSSSPLLPSLVVGWGFWFTRPRAAYSHSASVGRR